MKYPIKIKKLIKFIIIQQMNQDKEEKLNKIKYNLSSLKKEKEKEEEIDKLKNNIIVQRSDILNKLIKIS